MARPVGFWKMESIRQKPEASAVPDFRQLGVLLRVLLGANLIGGAAALLQAPAPGGWGAAYVDLSMQLQPVLLLSIVLLAASAQILIRLPLRVGQAVVVAGVGAVAGGLGDAFQYFGLLPAGPGALVRAALLAAMAAGGLLFYFELRARLDRPVAAEARLAALTARIRPHFLFNSLNAVLSLIRDDPRRAESALESLAELYRVLMRDPRDLTPLSEEIALCRQYLDLERLRLGDRLRVSWDIADVPDDAKVPPLMLQPLLENAVYHGIESAPDGGELKIRFARDDRALHIALENPVTASSRAQEGNRMALANIRERLMLHYDVEARLTVESHGGVFRVDIVIPYGRDYLLP